MDESEIAGLIQEDLPEADVEVTTPRHPDDDDHFAAVVVSPTFEGETLVDQHQQVYDALDDYLTTEIHAIELETYTPAEYKERESSE